MSKKVIVCGAGWAGLNAARVLVEHGYEVTVLEKSERVGGRITSDYIDGFTLDRGFQVINPAYAELKETQILNGVEFFKLPKGLEICTSEKLLRVGDFRKDLHYLPDLLSSRTGSLREKVSFLNYLRKPSKDITFEAALVQANQFFKVILKNFLDGVFLSDSALVANRMARELIHWFIKGSPGLPSGGVREVSEKLAAGLDIQFESEVLEIRAKEVVTSSSRMKADVVINALDPVRSAQLIRTASPKMNESHTWYFQIPFGEIKSQHLRVGGVGPLVNSIVISNVAPTYAPKGSALLAATTLGHGDEAEVKAHLKQHWQSETKHWNLIDVYRIEGSLPFHPPGKPLLLAPKEESGIYIAGDWRSTPSQQGALLSGRLVAKAVIAGQ